MQVIKGVRAQERLYRGVLWLVSVVFGGFIIGFGNLVIGDLPLVDEQVVAPMAGPSVAQRQVQMQIDAAGAESGRIDDRLEIQRLQLGQAQAARRTQGEAFSAWIQARTATGDPQQDPEVLSRTRQFEQLKDTERAIQQRIADLENRKAPLEQRLQTLRQQQDRLQRDAIPAQERAQFWQDLRVFLLRLAITLPMLAAAVWLVMKKRGSDYWPLARGFVLAAVFVFFVELVPYLPSYGGYVRYAVGIILTFAAGQFLIRKMRDYLSTRQAAEAQGEEERRRRVDQEEAFRKMAVRTCPGCDRPIATTGDAEANFCVHCGLTLFDHCPSCTTRKMAFFRYCMTCGTPSVSSPGAPVQASP